MTLYAIKTTDPPRPRYLALGCPATGWAHESTPPWRVIVSEDRTALPSMTSVVPYVGDEATVDVAVWLGESILRAEQRPERLLDEFMRSINGMRDEDEAAARALVWQVQSWASGWLATHGGVNR